MDIYKHKKPLREVAFFICLYSLCVIPAFLYVIPAKAGIQSNYLS